MTDIDRRSLIAAAGALAIAPTLLQAAPKQAAFPKGFLWGASTAGHQVDGKNTCCWRT